jgi:UDP-N-acetyl-L-fucosamine synthase
MKANGEVALRATDYQDDNVSAKVVKLIQSHTKIVNKFVWRKS